MGFSWGLSVVGFQNSLLSKFKHQSIGCLLATARNLSNLGIDVRFNSLVGTIPTNISMFRPLLVLEAYKPQDTYLGSQKANVFRRSSQEREAPCFSVVKVIDAT